MARQYSGQLQEDKEEDETDPGTVEVAGRGREGEGGTKADNLYQKKEEEEEWSVGGGGETLGAI